MKMRLSYDNHIMADIHEGWHRSNPLLSVGQAWPSSLSACPFGFHVPPLQQTKTRPIALSHFDIHQITQLASVYPTILSSDNPNIYSSIKKQKNDKKKTNVSMNCNRKQSPLHAKSTVSGSYKRTLDIPNISFYKQNIIAFIDSQHFLDQILIYWNIYKSICCALKHEGCRYKISSL